VRDGIDLLGLLDPLSPDLSGESCWYASRQATVSSASMPSSAHARVVENRVLAQANMSCTTNSPRYLPSLTFWPVSFVLVQRPVHQGACNVELFARVTDHLDVCAIMLSQ
jgi:hypothetical protein